MDPGEEYIEVGDGGFFAEQKRRFDELLHDMGRRILEADTTEAAAKILVNEDGFEPVEAEFAAALMRGETKGDVIVPPGYPET